VDSPWSQPGSTAGRPDRYQSRSLAGCTISAGSNGRAPSGAYIGGDSAPWSCERTGLTEHEAARLIAAMGRGYALPDPSSPIEHRVVRVSGVADDQAEAIALAEAAAVEMAREVAS